VQERRIPVTIASTIHSPAIAIFIGRAAAAGSVACSSSSGCVGQGEADPGRVTGACIAPPSIGRCGNTGPPQCRQRRVPGGCVTRQLGHHASCGYVVVT
jgi:hypothetical protein